MDKFDELIKQRFVIISQSTDPTCVEYDVGEFRITIEKGTSISYAVDNLELRIHLDYAIGMEQQYLSCLDLYNPYTGNITKSAASGCSSIALLLFDELQRQMLKALIFVQNRTISIASYRTHVMGRIMLKDDYIFVYLIANATSTLTEVKFKSQYLIASPTFGIKIVVDDVTRFLQDPRKSVQVV